MDGPATPGLLAEVLADEVARLRAVIAAGPFDRRVTARRVFIAGARRRVAVHLIERMLATEDVDAILAVDRGAEALVFSVGDDGEDGAGRHHQDEEERTHQEPPASGP